MLGQCRFACSQVTPQEKEAHRLNGLKMPRMLYQETKQKSPPLLKLLFLSTTQTYHVSACWKLLLILPVTSDLLCSCDAVRVQPPSADCNWLTSDSCVDPAPSLASHAACSLNICRKNSGLNQSKVEMPLKEPCPASKWLRWSIFTVCYDETISWHHQFNTLS